MDTHKVKERKNLLLRFFFIARSESGYKMDGQRMRGERDLLVLVMEVEEEEYWTVVVVDRDHPEQLMAMAMANCYSAIKEIRG